MDLLNGFAALFSEPAALALVFVGAVAGVLIGAVPGLTTAAAIAMLVPLTYNLSPLSALVFLYVIGKAGRYGGSIAAILFNTPGTAAAAATQNDGYPLSRQGKGGKAIKISALASGIGDTVGEILLIVGAVYIASLTIRLGPPEHFAIYVVAFIVIGSVVTESPIKGVASVLLGILVGTVGMSEITGGNRFDFGNVYLMGGVQLVPLMIGVFVMSEVISRLASSWTRQNERAREATIATEESTDPDANRITAEDLRYAMPVIFRSSLLGAFIGILPGIGSSVACFAAYGEERRRAERPQLWGKGAIEGVAAPEAANNAVSGPSMIPVLALGVPGSTIAAILMGVFMIHGIQVGPTIFTTSGEIVFALFAAGLLGIVCYVLFGYYFGGFIGTLIARVPVKFIYPTIFLLSIVATYTVRNNFFDVGVMAVAGGVGFLMRQMKFSPPAFIIAFILSRGAEESLAQVSMMSEQGIWFLLERPVASAILAIGMLVLLIRSVSIWRTKKSTGDS